MRATLKRAIQTGVINSRNEHILISSSEAALEALRVPAIVALEVKDRALGVTSVVALEVADGPAAAEGKHSTAGEVDIGAAVPVALGVAAIE